MNSNDFCYWLQGFVELTGGERPTQEQWESIVEHLGLVFHKVTKPVAKKEPAKHEILVEEGPSPEPVKDEPKKASPQKDDTDWWEILKKQMEDYERIKKETDPFTPGVPYTYPPFIPQQPGWPGVGNPDWYDPLGYPKIIC